MGDLEGAISFTPDQHNGRECELYWLPGGLQRTEQVLASGRRRGLTNAEVGGKARREARLLIVGRESRLQRRLQGCQGLVWFRLQPQRCLPTRMGERPEGRQGHLEWGEVPHGLRQHE